ADEGRLVSRIRGVGFNRLFAYRAAVERHLFGMVIERYPVVRQNGQPDVTVGLFDLGGVGRAVYGADVNRDRLDLRFADGDRIEQPVNDRERTAPPHRPRVAPVRDGFDAQLLADRVANHQQAGPAIADEPQLPFATARTLD